jgi:hypothetical protein
VAEDDGKLARAHGGCLGTERRRRTQQPAKRRGEQEACIDPRISEWGNPAGVMFCHPKGSKPGEVKHLSTRRKRHQMRFP